MKNEVVSQHEVSSPYRQAAQVEVRRKSPGIEPRIKESIQGILTDIDSQMMRGLTQFSSSDYGVSIPYTHVSVTEIAQGMSSPGKIPAVASTENNTKPASEKIIYVVFPGIAMPPGGHAFTVEDMVYDRVMTSLSKVVGTVSRGGSTPDIQIISLGSPNGPGGNVTEEWIKNIKEHGFSPYGTAYAELLRNAFPEILQEETKVIFHGMSLGSKTAEETAKALYAQQHDGKTVPGNLQILLDNPVTDHRSLLKGFQVPIWYGVEAFIRSKMDRRLKSALADEKVFLELYRKSLQDQGADLYEHPKSLKLKWQAVHAEVAHIVKGVPYDQTLRMFVRKGLLDPTTYSPRRHLQAVAQSLQKRNTVTAEGNVIQFAIKQSHFINRYRVGRWEQHIRHWEKLLGAI